MLFETPGPFVRLSLYLIIPAVMATALFFSLTIGLALKAYRKKPVTGKEELLGMEGIAKTVITPEGGTVSLHGELWGAYAEEQIPKDHKVVVESVSGLRLKVHESKGG
jgi:membrane-bound serine protease (ClpP class)